MKKCLIISIFFIILFGCKKKAEDENKNIEIKLFVFANGGLNLRERPDVNSSKIAFLNDGEFVTLISKEKMDTINNINGEWYKIKYSDKIGYAFNYLLSNIELKEEKFSPSKIYSYKIYGYKDELCKNDIIKEYKCFVILSKKDTFIESFADEIIEWVGEDEIVLQNDVHLDDESFYSKYKYNLKKKELALMEYSRSINTGWYGGKEKVDSTYISGKIVCNQSKCFIFLKDKNDKIHLFNAKLLPTEFKSQQHHMLDKPDAISDKEIELKEDISIKLIIDNGLTFHQDSNFLIFEYKSESDDKNNEVLRIPF